MFKHFKVIGSLVVRSLVVTRVLSEGYYRLKARFG